jgi:predicted nucleic acid-binding protein
VTRWYLDTSAAMKLVVEEAESAALATTIDDGPLDLVACMLLETELRRAAHRLGATQLDVTGMLAGVALYEVSTPLFREAGLLPGANLGSLDALHLAAAVRLDVAGVLTYDGRMAAAAADLGLVVDAPA